MEGSEVSPIVDGSQTSINDKRKREYKQINR